MKTKRPLIANKNKSVKSKKTLRNLILLCLTVIGIIFANYFFTKPSYDFLTLQAKDRAWFTHQSLLENVYAFFDVSVADIDSDDRIDILTVSHSGQQYLLQNSNEGNFSSDNAIAKFGLSQDPDFPGLDVEKAPEINNPGIYFYWRNRNFIVQTKGLEIAKPITGKIDFFVPAKVKDNKSFEIELEDTKIPTGAKISSVDFVTQAETGTLAISTYNTSLPVTLKLDREIPLEQIYIGNQGINPTSHEFSLYLRDRHGMAWTDLDGQGNLDVFVGRGALRNRADLYPEKYIAGELLVNNNQSEYQNLSEGLGISQGCNATQAAWIDFDTDNLLDLYVACETATAESRPNLLFHQNSEGKFKDVAAEVGLDLAKVDSSFIWFDADNDGDSDLFLADEESFNLYVNDGGNFSAQTIDAKHSKKPIAGAPKYKWFKYNLTVADYDADGDIDVFAASPTGNAVFTNNSGKFELLEPTSLGLSQWDLTANWVDYDNDGLLDLHLFPHGIYQQQEPGKFAATNLLQGESSNLMTAISTWFDSNNDGFRDLLIATQHPSSPYKKLYGKAMNKIWQEPVVPDDWNWQLALYPNATNDNHWLQLQLVGTENNRSAIGAKVELVTSERTQLQIVGQSEGSRASQGHYRLYFGLGEQPQIDKVKVTWSDGSIREIINPESDRLLTVRADDI